MKKFFILISVCVIVIFSSRVSTSKHDLTVDSPEPSDLPNIVKLADDKVEEIKLQKEIEKLEAERLAELEARKLQEEKQRAKKEVATRGSVNRGIFTATAYDLTVESCGKKQDHPLYGITASGANLKGHTLYSARAIAVDRNVIPLEAKVYLEFLDEEYKHLDGEYTAVDTGSAIKGHIIDVFFGDTGDKHTDQAVWDFGRRKVRVTVLNN